MSGWLFVGLAIAIASGVLGYGKLNGKRVGTAIVIFYLSLAFVAIVVLGHMINGPPPR